MINVLFNLAGMGIVKLIVGLLPNNNYDQFDNVLQVGSHVLNIFAWANKFVPTGLIMILLGLTTTLLLSKMLMNLIFRFLNKIS